MTDERGVYDKFRVERTDASPRHPDCRYFVLDIDHDPHAAAALTAYAEHCQRDKPDLARDLRRLTGSSIIATTPGLAADLARGDQPQGEHGWPCMCVRCTGNR